MRYELVQAAPSHIVYVASNIAQEDRAETLVMGFSTPLEALRRSAQASRDTRAGIVAGHPLVIVGVAQETLTSDVGHPWMLGTREVPSHARAVMEGSREVITQYLQWYRLLYNIVDARHTRAVRWLRWLGFTIEPAQPLGPKRALFHKFWMEMT